jgi:hypothetical protein
MICDKYRGKNTGPQCVNFEKCTVQATKKKNVLFFCMSVLDLREGRRLRAFGCRMLRKIFGPERGEVNWRVKETT